MADKDEDLVLEFPLEKLFLRSSVKQYMGEKELRILKKFNV
jgi:hypothetical protein